MRRGRLVALIAVVAAAVGIAVRPRGESASANTPAVAAARGNFAGRVSIGGGRKLYLSCAGMGSPTVILESGIHDSSDPWTLTASKRPVLGSPAVFTGVARFTHVCMYDRPGTIRYTTPLELAARSTPVNMPRSLPSMVADLHSLMRSAGLHGPYLLVAHSYGGLIAQLFAQTYRSEIVGMVLVDAFGVDIKRLFGRRLWPRYTDLLNHPGTALDNQPGFETVDVDGAIKAVQRAKPLPRIPLAVISKTEPFGTAPGVPRDLSTRLETVWPEVQMLQVKLEPSTPLVYATGSDHYVQIHDPDLTISTIRLILDRARHHE